VCQLSAATAGCCHFGTIVRCLAASTIGIDISHEISSGTILCTNLWTWPSGTNKFCFTSKITFSPLSIPQLVHLQNPLCSFLRRFSLILLSSLKKTRWGIDGGEKVKFGGEKKCITVIPGIPNGAKCERALSLCSGMGLRPSQGWAAQCCYNAVIPARF
jgi:hypothetical protein